MHEPLHQAYSLLQIGKPDSPAPELQAAAGSSDPEQIVLDTVARLLVGADVCTAALIDQQKRKLIVSSNVSEHQAASDSRVEAKYTFSIHAEHHGRFDTYRAMFENVMFEFTGSDGEVHAVPAGVRDITEAELQQVHLTKRLNIQFIAFAHHHRIQGLPDVAAELTLDFSLPFPNSYITRRHFSHSFQLNPLKRRCTTLMEHLYMLYQVLHQGREDEFGPDLATHRKRVLRQGLQWRLAEHSKSELHLHNNNMLQLSNAMQESFDAIFEGYVDQVLRCPTEGKA